MAIKQCIAALAATAALMAASGIAGAAPVQLQAFNQRSASGVLSYLAFKNCAPAVGNGCYNPANPWVIANGVTGSTATWDWNGSVLTGTARLEATVFINSNPSLGSILDYRVLDLVINTGTLNTTASVFNCIEGSFVITVGAQACAETGTGANTINESSVAYNVGGDANCSIRTVGGDDTITRPQVGLTARSAGGGCDAQITSFSQYTVVQNNLSIGGTLILSNGICMGANQTVGNVNAACANASYLTFSAAPVPAAVWLLGSALGMLGWVRRKAVS